MYCDAVNALASDQPETMLYTSYGSTASHRTTLLRSRINFNLTFWFRDGFDPSPIEPRLINHGRAGWIEVHGYGSPIVDIPGFDAWRLLAFKPSWVD